MAYDENLGARIQQIFHSKKITVTEKLMFGGVAFMLDDKMCVGVVKDDLMVRVHPDEHDALLQKPGARTMDFTGKPMIGYIFVSPEGVSSSKELSFWIDKAVAYNPLIKKKTAKKKK